ncbi:MAG TPA: asparaginase [Mycobacterium sp.]|jgi:L-asparaginase
MSRVVVITTGGTIASVADDAGVLRPARTGAEILDGLDADVVDVMNKDSSQLRLADWDTLSAAISSVIDDGADGVVVTHGTDTMEETALWLELTYDGAAPVVLTGAAKGADAPDSDGSANLRDAAALAARADARGLGVVVAFGGKLLAPLGMRKVAGGFDGPEGRDKDRPFLGTVPAVSAPRVDVVSCYLGGDAVTLDACVAAGARALVLESLGSGNAPDAVVDAVRRHCADGVTVVVSTRVPFGGVSARYGPGREMADAGAVIAPRLGPPQTRVLVMAALAAGSSVDEVVARWG